MNIAKILSNPIFKSLYAMFFLCSLFKSDCNMIAAIMKMNGMKGALNLVSPWMASTSESDPPITIINGMNACLY